MRGTKVGSKWGWNGGFVWSGEGTMGRGAKGSRRAGRRTNGGRGAPLGSFGAGGAGAGCLMFSCGSVSVDAHVGCGFPFHPNNARGVCDFLRKMLIRGWQRVEGGFYRTWGLGQAGRRTAGGWRETEYWELTTEESWRGTKRGTYDRGRLPVSESWLGWGDATAGKVTAGVGE